MPTRSIDDVESYNVSLLDECAGLSEKQHYKKNLAVKELFEDRAALLGLPSTGFSCVAWKQFRCNLQGSFAADGNHRYFAGLACAKRDVVVAMGRKRSETWRFLLSRRFCVFGSYGVSLMPPGFRRWSSK